MAEVTERDLEAAADVISRWQGKEAKPLIAAAIAQARIEGRRALLEELMEMGIDFEVAPIE